MKIAIIGTGISGLVAAREAHNMGHDVTLYEKENRVGGHTHTHDIELDSQQFAVDTGFIVYNDWTYPNFIALMEDLGVPSQPSAMSFSVKSELNGLEYNGTTLNTLFAQRRNVFSPRFYWMIKDILRFNREAPFFLTEGDDHTTLGQYLACHGYGKPFKDQYIIPMGAAIWSAAPADMLDFPVKFFIRFFSNHGMLSVDNRPQWRVIKGGSSRYIEPLIAPFKDRIRLSTVIQFIDRNDQGVTVKTTDEQSEHYDAIVLACHSDEALSLLKQPTSEENTILRSIPYQENEVVLHTDSRVLPKAKLAWAAWNYHIPKINQGRVAVTYNMNILQGIDAKQTFCVSLNYSEAIDEHLILKRLSYHHPSYSTRSVEAQARHHEISGLNRTYYAGAYWGFGFHEDGVKSGLKVASQLQSI